MNLLNEKFASMFRTYGAEQKIEEKRMIRKDSLNTWETEDRFYPMVRYKYNRGLLFNRKDSLITLAIKVIPLILISAWLLSRFV
ncbi:MAG: hypothetical protein HKN68_00835 [Saprospiraceae bacterium]|nr:hypothetical protein [Saprospiraceae bacterium]